jgi:hypothetical protein
MIEQIRHLQAAKPFEPFAVERSSVASFRFMIRIASLRLKPMDTARWRAAAR